MAHTERMTVIAEKFGNRDYLLAIEYATLNEDAEYTVIARNVAGEARSVCQLIVEPKHTGNLISALSGDGGRGREHYRSSTADVYLLDNT